MPSMDDAAAIALALPGVSEGSSYGRRAWLVGRHRFAWDRPFSKADVRRFGDAPVPDGDILALAVEDLGDKAALIAAHEAVFDIPHLDGYPIVLVRLDLASRSALAELIEDAWATVAR